MVYSEFLRKTVKMKNFTAMKIYMSGNYTNFFLPCGAFVGGGAMLVLGGMGLAAKTDNGRGTN